MIRVQTLPCILVSRFVLLFFFALSAVTYAGPPSGPRSAKLVNLSTVPLIKAREVVVTGNVAWVAQNLDGMTAVDISRPGKPRIVKSFGSDRIQPLGLTTIAPSHLIIADRFRGLVIWDVKHADRPTSLSCIGLPGIASHVAVGTIGKRRIAAVACAGEGLTVVDITDMKTPRVVGRFTMRIDYSRRVFLDGNLCYLADHFDGGLKVVDLSVPENPMPIFQIAMKGFCESVGLNKSLLTVGYRNYGIRYFDVQRHFRSDSAMDRQSTPTISHLCTVSRSNTRVRTMDFVPGKFLAIANDESGIELYDLADRSRPLLAAEYTFTNPSQSAQSVLFHKGLLLVPAWDGGLYIFRVET